MATTQLPTQKCRVDVTTVGAASGRDPLQFSLQTHSFQMLPITPISPAEEQLKSEGEHKQWSHFSELLEPLLPSPAER